MASKDFDKFVGFATENVLKNWEKLVVENIKNDLDGIKSPTMIPMDEALEKYLGTELTPEEMKYFKDKVFVSMDISNNLPNAVTDPKTTVTVNYVKYDSEE